MQYIEFSESVKNENFQKKFFDIFLIFAQNIDCGYTLEPPRRGGSNEYPQSMFWSKNKKNRYTPAYSSFRGYTFHGHVFMMKLVLLFHLLEKTDDLGYRPRPEDIKLFFSCSTQLSIKFKPLLLHS